jgi:hypothetical protein
VRPGEELRRCNGRTRPQRFLFPQTFGSGACAPARIYIDRWRVLASAYRLMRPRQLLTAAVLFFCLMSSTINAQQQARGSNVLVSQGVMNAFLLKKVMPVYSDDVKSVNTSGQIVLALTIDKGGKVSHAMVVERDLYGRKSVNINDPHLRQTSLDAVKQWTYRPYLLQWSAGRHRHLSSSVI